MKNLKKIGALVLVVVMMLSLSVTAFAADLEQDGANATSDNSINIKTAVIITNNETTAASGKTVAYPAMSFTHTYEPATVTDNTTVTDGSVTAHVKTGVANGLTITETGITGATAVLNSNGQKVVYATTNFKVNLNNYSSAGIYRYKITDTSATDTTNKTALENAGVVQGAQTDTEYFLDVYIKNGTSGLEVGGYVLTSSNVETIDTSTGKESGFDNITTDTSGELTGTAADLTKNYSYTTYNVTLNKAVAGDMGDKNHGFPFAVAITNNSLAYGYEVTGNHLTTLNHAYNALEAIPADFALSDGGTLKIWGLSPLATVNYTETNDTIDTYKVKVGNTAGAADVQTEADVASNGTKAAFGSATAVTTGYTISTTATLNEAADAIYFTNTLNNISPTGVILRVAPYALMLGVGLFLVLFSRKRREAENEE